MNDEDIIIRYIETTGRCNMRCPVCTKRIRNYDMPEEEYNFIVKRNKDLLKKQAVWLDFNGEPLMDKFIFERIKLLKLAGAEARISTNGVLLSEENIEKLIEAGHSMISVSVMTLDAQMYKIYRGSNDLALVLHNLLVLKQKADVSRKPIIIQAVKLDLKDKSENNKFIAYFHSLGIDVALHKFTNRAQNVILDLSEELPPLERHECVGLKQNIVILANCDVVTCCCDYCGNASIGNLKDYNYSVKQLVEQSGVFNYPTKRKQLFLTVCEKCKDWLYYQKDTTEEYVELYPVKR